MCELADQTGPLAGAAANFVSEVQASQFDRHPEG
jgi:hypothetical protein